MEKPATPEQLARAEQLKRELLATLNPDDQQLFRLLIEGYTLPEVSGRLNLSYTNGPQKGVLTKPGEMIRYAQFIASLLPQTFRDGAYGELCAGIDRLVRYRLMSCCGSGVDEMSVVLLAEDRQRCCDAVQHAFDVDVDHVLPL